MKLSVLLALFFNISATALCQGSADACLRLQSTVIDGKPAIGWQKVGKNVKLAVWGRSAPTEQFKLLEHVDNTGVSPGSEVEHFVIPDNQLEMEFFVETLNDTAFRSGLWRTGYISTAMNKTATQAITHRRVLLLIDDVAATALSAAIAQWKLDLHAEGFTCDVQAVDERVKTALDVKSIILQHASDTTRGHLTHVLLCGRIPYAYSGGFDVGGAFPQPDGHPEHGGAWASDAYYADLYTSPGIDAEYQWTDDAVNISGVERPARWQNRNVPGDGKFDQSVIPTDLELCIGRIDMRNLPVFGTSEADRTVELSLMSRYFEKNHGYRSGDQTVAHRAIVDDNFGVFADAPDESRVYVESFAASGYRSFSPIVGRNNVVVGDWFPEPNGVKPSLDTFDCLFAYGCGPGGYNHCDFVGLSADFAKHPVNAVFTLLFGSYFGDVDSDDNFLRCVLAAEGRTLTTGYSGRPQWFLHDMSTGSTIGEGARLSANNQEVYIGSTLTNPLQKTRTYMPFSQRYVHVMLLGDPTLSVYSNRIEGDLKVTKIGSDSVLLNWNSAQNKGEPITYVVESGAALNLPFTPITEHQSVSGLEQQLPLRTDNQNTFYRVRPVTMPNNTRVAPIIGRGVLAAATTVGVEEYISNSVLEFKIINLMGIEFGQIKTRIQDLQKTAQTLGLPSGSYWAVSPSNNTKARGFLVLQ